MTWLLAVALISAAIASLGAVLLLKLSRERKEAREAIKDASLRGHMQLAELDRLIAEVRAEMTNEYVAAPQKAAPTKAEPIFDDDEDTEPFDISLQVYGDLPEGKSAASAISFAMTRWLREGAPAGGYTASNELRVHLRCMHGRNRDPESGGEACQ